MWRASLAPLAEERGVHARIWRGAEPMAFTAAASGWMEDPAFRSFTSALLADMPYPAFRWETPAYCADSRDRPFEFVVLDCPELDRPSDPAAFAGHFPAGDTSLVKVVANLGGDACLVIPRPLGPAAHHAHLGAFVRGAPAEQQQALWRGVGDALARDRRPAPAWLSTAGLGVPWLHVRIDQRPKYYGYAPYRRGDGCSR